MVERPLRVLVVSAPAIVAGVLVKALAVATLILAPASTSMVRSRILAILWAIPLTPGPLLPTVPTTWISYQRHTTKAIFRRTISAMGEQPLTLHWSGLRTV